MASILKFTSRQYQNGMAANDLNRADDPIHSTLETLIQAAHAVANRSNSAAGILLLHLEVLEKTFTQLDDKSRVELVQKADAIRKVLERMRIDGSSGV